MASMLRTKLSLNAEKNWHQNKRRKSPAAHQGGERRRSAARRCVGRLHRAGSAWPTMRLMVLKGGADLTFERIDLVMHLVDAERRDRRGSDN